MTVQGGEVTDAQLSMLRGWREAAADALSLVMPVWCAACDHPGRALCDPCVAALADPRPVAGAGVSTWSMLRYEGAGARVVRSLKQEGRTGIARPLGRLLHAALVEQGWDHAALVPVPTTRAAMRRRGYAVPEVLARRAGRAPARLLRVQGGAVSDQRTLGRAERERNVAGTFVVRAQARGTDVVVVDDVVTTGATIREAARALAVAGAHVLGAVTVADTPKRI